MRKTIGIYEYSIPKMNGVLTFLYNFCYNLRNYYDITIVYVKGEESNLLRLSKLVKLVKYNELPRFDFDIVIRNSVWGDIPDKIYSKDNVYIEMRHADYNFLASQNRLFTQYTKWNRVNKIVACGEHVAKMSHKVLKDNPTVIKNILLPKKEPNRILHLITCSRIDRDKGYDRMLILASMLRNNNIKFEWKIFTHNVQSTPFEEFIFMKPRHDIFDQLAEADYCVLLSDTEGLPYTIQEALQYKTPCIVTDIEGCTELIQDGVNGYVVPLDMNFDVKKLLKIPKPKDYDNHALESWLEYLGGGEYIEKPKVCTSYKVRATDQYKIHNFLDVELNRIPEKGEEWVVNILRAKTLAGDNSQGIKFVDLIEEIWE